MAAHKPLDPSFAERAPEMSILEACNHYAVSKNTVKHWATLVSPTLWQLMADNGRANSLRATKGQVQARRIVKACSNISRENLDVSAMRYIQRTKRWVCYSSRIHEQKGDVIYYVGNLRLGYAGLIAIAESFGFERPGAIPSR